MRDALAVVHAVAAVVALGTGVWLLRQVATHRRPTLLAFYYAAIVVMAAALPVLVGLDWADLRTPTRAAFIALCVLAGTMVWEADRARRFQGRVHAPLSPARSAAFVEAVGFTVIALLDGFAIITALDLGAPGWVVTVVGVAVVVAARPAIVATRRRVMPSGRRTLVGDGRGGRYRT